MLKLLALAASKKKKSYYDVEVGGGAIGVNAIWSRLEVAADGVISCQ